MSACLAANLNSPSKIVVIDNSEKKLQMLPKGIVTDTVCSASLLEGQVAEKLKSINDGHGFDYVLDCAGVGALIGEGLSALAARGTIITVGGGPSIASLPLGEMLLKGATYRGTHQGDAVSATVSYAVKIL